MRVCAACQHENADHLGFCAQCGHRLPGSRRLSAAPSVAATLQLKTSAVPAVVVAGVPPSPAGARIAEAVAWMRGSVIYVFSHLRGRIETLRRRRALEAERNGEQRLLRRAVAELGVAVRDQGIEPPALRELIESVRQTELRRDAAVAALAEAERLQIEEDARLVAGEREAGAQVRTSEGALRQAEEALRSAVIEQQALMTLAAGGAAGAGGGGQAMGELPTVGLPRGVTHVAELERRITGLRADVDRLRTDLQAARVRFDQAIAGRRQAAHDLAVSLAGRRRDSNDAEARLREVLERLGDAALAERPASPALEPLYERIGQLAGTVLLREQQLHQLERDLDRLDPKRITAGLALLALPLLIVLTFWLTLK